MFCHQRSRKTCSSGKILSASLVHVPKLSESWESFFFSDTRNSCYFQISDCCQRSCGLWKHRSSLPHPRGSHLPSRSRSLSGNPWRSGGQRRGDGRSRVGPAEPGSRVAAGAPRRRLGALQPLVSRPAPRSAANLLRLGHGYVVVSTLLHKICTSNVQDPGCQSRLISRKVSNAFVLWKTQHRVQRYAGPNAASPRAIKYVRWYCQWQIASSKSWLSLISISKQTSLRHLMKGWGDVICSSHKELRI